MPVVLKNNAFGFLQSAISNSDTTAVLTTGTGANFPTLSSGEYFYATISPIAGASEIVKVTARSGDLLTIVRAQEGTSALSFPAGSRVELRVTARSVLDAIDDKVATKDQASEIAFTPVGGISSTNVQTALAEVDSKKVALTRLTDNSGANLVGFLQAGTGAVARTVQDKLREVVSVKDFGAVGDGVTDDTAAFQAAIDSLGTAGGVVRVVGKYRIASDLTVKLNVFLVGDFRLPGRPATNSRTPADYSAISSGSLRLEPTATIKLQGGAGLEGLLIYRHGMVFPATTSSTAAEFAGTAVTVVGDDASVRACMIMGFDKAIYSNGANRLRVDYLYHDNNNGIEIASAFDIPYLTNCHAWAFATVVANHSWQNTIRPGTAYYIRDVVDWARLTNCFSYGYKTGFRIENVHSTILTACGADNPFSSSPLYNGSTGFMILGSSHETKLIGCQAAAQRHAGVLVNTHGDINTFIDELTAWGCGDHGVLVAGGDVTVSGGLVRSTTNGVTVNSGGSRVVIRGMTFVDIYNRPITMTAMNAKTRIIDCNYTNHIGTPVGNPNLLVIPSVASNAEVLLPNTGDMFLITGTNNFGRLMHGWAGREVTLFFNGALTVHSSTGLNTSMRLKDGVNFTTSPGSVLVLKHNGTQWYEVGRS